MSIVQEWRRARIAVACIAAATAMAAAAARQAAPAAAPLDPALVRPFLADYADYAHATYARTIERAERLAAAIDELGRRPDAATLAAARAAWIEAREPYGR